MTDADKLRHISSVLQAHNLMKGTGAYELLSRIASLLDAVPPETLAALKAREPTEEMVRAGARAIIALTRTVETHSIKPTIDEIEKMLNEEEPPNINMGSDGTITVSRPVVVMARTAAESVIKAVLFPAAPAKPEG